MDEEQFEELQRMVHTTVSQSESRLMAHIGGIERRLYTVEQGANSLHSQLNSLSSESRIELERIRHDLEQLQSRLH